MTTIKIAHDDHGLEAPHIAVLEAELADWEGEFTLRVVDLPEGCPSLQCALYGPSVGDAPIEEPEVTYVRRNGRPGPSRMLPGAPQREARRMVIIAGPGKEGPMVYTAYGTRGTSPAPREWWDSGMTPSEAIEAAGFWCLHALAF